MPINVADLETVVIEKLQEAGADCLGPRRRAIIVQSISKIRWSVCLWTEVDAEHRGWGEEVIGYYESKQMAVQAAHRALEGTL